MSRFKSLLSQFDIIILVAIACFIILAYWSLPDTFFQQDEWWAFGIYNIKNGLGGTGYFIKEALINFEKVHYSPLAALGFYLQYKLFDLHFSFYAYVSIFMHIANTVAVFVFIKQLVKSRYVAFLSSIIFATNSVSNQAVSWIAASLNTQSATFFSLVFYILFLQFLKNKEKSKKILTLAFCALVIGLLFKEIVAPFLLVPVFYFLYYSGNKSFVPIKKIFTPFIVFLSLYLLLRFIMYLNAPPIFGSGNVELVQAGIQNYIYRAVALPFRVITQSLIPQNYLLSISEYFIQLSYPQFSYSDGSVDAVIRETIAYDMICFFISILIMTAAFFSYKYFKNTNKYFAKGIVLFLFIAIFSPILIIFIPGKAGYVSLIESRHLYSGSFAVAGFLVLTFFGFLSRITKNKAKTTLFIIVLIIVILNIWKVRNDINELKKISILRKYILTEIMSKYPNLSDKIIIYTTSDKAYYGMPDKEKILPIQVGFGWMLLVWYSRNEHFPSCLYDTTLFLDILGEGYKECGGRGFGYFRDYDKLIDVVNKNGITTEEIIAYNWDSQKEKFTDISFKIIDKVKNSNR